MYFNTFRNNIDFILEEKLNEHQILVERGVTKDRVNKEHFDKDDWLQTKVAANEIQKMKNDMLVRYDEISHQVEEKLETLDEINEFFENMPSLDLKIQVSNLKKENDILIKENSVLKDLMKN